MHVMLYILECLFNWLYYHEKCYLNPSGRLVDRLPNLYEWIDDLHDWFSFDCELLRTSFAAVSFTLCLGSSLGLWLRCQTYTICLCFAQTCYLLILRFEILFGDVLWCMWHGYFEIILYVDEMLWYYSTASFEKLIMHVLD